MMDPSLLKRILLHRLLLTVLATLAVTGFAIWLIISHAPKPGSPAELSPRQQVRYCEMRCAATCRQCEDTCLRDISGLAEAR